MKTWIAAAALTAMTAQGASAQSIDAGNPANVAKTLTEMGYKTNALDTSRGTPMFTAAINDWNTVFVFGDCATPTSCKYIVLVSSFTDVIDAPAAWVNQINADLDIGKVWTDKETKKLSFSAPIPLGDGKLQRETLRFMLDHWLGMIQYMSEAAAKEKLVK